VEAKAGSLGRGLPAGPLEAELTETLQRGKGLRIERIVSTGQATPEGEWYDQEDDEFVLLVAGAARLLIAGDIVAPARCALRGTVVRRLDMSAMAQSGHSFRR
jgi:hypothetical protein